MSMSISLHPVCSYPEGKDVTVQISMKLEGVCWPLKIIKVDLIEDHIFVLFRSMMDEEFGRFVCFHWGGVKTEIEVKLPHELNTSDLKVHSYFLDRQMNEKEKNFLESVSMLFPPKNIDLNDEADTNVITINDEAEYTNALKIIQEKGS